MGRHDDSAEERVAIFRRFGNGFAEAEGVASPVVYGEAEVVRCDGAANGGAEGEDGVEGRGGTAVL
jgi:hypothetical protein